MPDEADEATATGAVWDAALDALRERRDLRPDDDVFDGLDPKRVRTVLHDMVEKGWLDRNETRGVFQRTGKLTFEPSPHGVSDHALDRAQHADDLRKNGAFRRAASWYTTASYCYLGDRPPSTRGHEWGAVGYLYRGVLCYRLAGHDARADRCAATGRTVATDVLDEADERFAPDEPSEEWLGSWCEAVGDFRILVGEDPLEAYSDAWEHYDRAQYPPRGYLAYEDANNWPLISQFNVLCRDTDLGVAPWTDEHQEQLTPLTEWLDYKWQHLPRLIDALLDRGEWP